MLLFIYYYCEIELWVFQLMLRNFRHIQTNEIAHILFYIIYRINPYSERLGLSKTILHTCLNLVHILLIFYIAVAE